jgi:DNA helicase TIP49 (TBP-interacting protein)
MHKLKVDGKYIMGAVNQFCKNRREINKLIREKANEKIKELSEQGDVKWLNQ